MAEQLPQGGVGIAAVLDLPSFPVQMRADLTLHHVPHRPVRPMLSDQPLHREPSDRLTPPPTNLNHRLPTLAELTRRSTRTIPVNVRTRGF